LTNQCSDGDGDGIVWRAAVAALWPVRMLARGLVALFWLVNSTIETVSVVVAALGGYALVRLKWRGANGIGIIMLIAYLMPTALMFNPLYYILVRLRLPNTVLGTLGWNWQQ
jgi:ABC-type glycerol-3-phosphate transport system permease component